MDSLVWLTSNLWVFPTLKYLYNNVAGNIQNLLALCVDFSGRVFSTRDCYSGSFVPRRDYFWLFMLREMLRFDCFCFFVNGDEASQRISAVSVLLQVHILVSIHSVMIAHASEASESTIALHHLVLGKNITLKIPSFFHLQNQNGLVLLPCFVQDSFMMLGR